ncbi:adenylate cyclase [Acrasis kona]|uniref:Adenylate cyclase n=1 Tax=Acrasis kona TaxID=1008807 RepID=A0AAW2YX71_9EUKA
MIQSPLEQEECSEETELITHESVQTHGDEILSMRGKGLIGYLERIPMWSKLTFLSSIYMLGLLCLGAIAMYSYGTRLRDAMETHDYINDSNVITKGLIDSINYECTTTLLFLKNDTYKDSLVEATVRTDTKIHEAGQVGTSPEYDSRMNKIVDALTFTRDNLLMNRYRLISNYSSVMTNAINLLRNYGTNTDSLKDVRTKLISLSLLKVGGLKIGATVYAYLYNDELQYSGEVEGHDEFITELTDNVREYQATIGVVLSYITHSEYRTLLKTVPIGADQARVNIEQIMQNGTHPFPEATIQLVQENLKNFSNIIDTAYQNCIRPIQDQIKNQENIAIIIFVVALTSIIVFSLLACISGTIVSATIVGPWKRLNELQELAIKKFVPQEFLKLIRCRIISDVKLSTGVEANINMMLVEIKDFYLMTQNMSSHDTLNFLNYFLSSICPNIRRHNGFIEKYNDNGFSAIFMNNTNASAAAKKIREDTVEFNKDYHDFPNVVVCITMHSHEVLMGTIGESERMNPVIVSIEPYVNTYLSRVSDILRMGGDCILLTQTALPINTDHVRYLCDARAYRYDDRPSVGVYEMFDESNSHKIETKVIFEEGTRLFCKKQYYDAFLKFDQVSMNASQYKEGTDPVCEKLASLCRGFIMYNENLIESLDLEQVLRNPRLRASFEGFSEKEFSSENIRLWKSIQEFLICKEERRRSVKAFEIYTTFVNTDSNSAVNMGDLTRKSLSTRFEPIKPITDQTQMPVFEANIFHELLRECKLNMNDTLKRFKNSEACRQTYMSLNLEKFKDPFYINQ